MSLRVAPPAAAAGGAAPTHSHREAALPAHTLHLHHLDGAVRTAGRIRQRERKRYIGWRRGGCRAEPRGQWGLLQGWQQWREPLDTCSCCSPIILQQGEQCQRRNATSGLGRACRGNTGWTIVRVHRHRTAGRRHRQPGGDGRRGRHCGGAGGGMGFAGQHLLNWRMKWMCHYADCWEAPPMARWECQSESASLVFAMLLQRAAAATAVW